jgi:hypothetical protein
MKIVTCIFATIGLACIVKHIMHHKESCGWHKVKVENEESTVETAPHEIKVEDEEKRTGTRYGSNPVKY